MTCCPFQYLTRLSDCSVVMMSCCVMDVIAERSLMLSVPLQQQEKLGMNHKVVLLYLKYSQQKIITFQNINSSSTNYQHKN